MLPTTYFGPISWYRALCQEVSPLDNIIDRSEHYVKQTTRNHCRIATANGVQKLTVPVSMPTKNHCPIRDVRVSDHGNWRHQHWEALCSAYGMSPFFEYYADDIRPFFERKWDFLFDYNLEITKKILELVQSSEFIVHSDSSPLRQPNYELCTMNYELKKDYELNNPYYQTFHLRHGFIPDLSILDLLFNMGPEAILKLY